MGLVFRPSPQAAVGCLAEPPGHARLLATVEPTLGMSDGPLLVGHGQLNQEKTRAAMHRNHCSMATHCCRAA